MNLENKGNVDRSSNKCVCACICVKGTEVWRKLVEGAGWSVVVVDGGGAMRYLGYNEAEHCELLNSGDDDGTYFEVC